MHQPRHPLHITLRAVGGLPSLRERRAFLRVQAAIAGGNERFGFRVVHFSVQREHLHLIAEAQDRLALSRGMQGLCIRIARAVNGTLQRRGRVFADRYHARALKTPREVRFALRYVLLNLRKHAPGSLGPAGVHGKGHKPSHRSPRRPLGPHQHTNHEHSASRPSVVPTPGSGTPSSSPLPAGFVDTCSSAPWFDGFARPRELAFGAQRARFAWTRASGSAEPPVVPARSWLLVSGWRRAGPFDVDEIPGR